MAQWWKIWVWCRRPPAVQELWVPSPGNLPHTGTFNEYPRLIFFRIDCFDLLAGQGILKSLLYHHSSKASILLHSALWVQISYPCMTSGKTIASTIWTFVGKEMSLLLNSLSMFAIVFLPRSKCLLISWLQSLSTVILGPKKIKSVTASTFFPFYFPWSDGTRCHDLSFLTLSFKPGFSLCSFTFIKRLFSSSSLSAIEWYHLHMLGWWYFSQQTWL